MREMTAPRAWHKELGEMVVILAINWDTHGDMTWLEIAGAEYGIEASSPLLEVTPDQLEFMWPTGLQDKNAKEIYEGDVVAEVIDGEQGDMYVIEWSRDGNHCYYAGYRTDDRSLETEMQLFELGALEVLGNIHQNPELLGEKK